MPPLPHPEDQDAGTDYGSEEEDDPNLQLERDRRANDERLKGRFENIFRKYGKDFGDVADEVDIQTGKIVVDNGHLSSMRHEVDPGQAPASRFMMDFALEGDEGSSAGDVESMGDADSDGGTRIDPQLRKDASQRVRSTKSPRVAPGSSGKRPRLSPSLFVAAQEETQSGTEDDSADTASEAPGQPTLFQQLPSLQKAMVMLKAQTGRGKPVDPDAINALGQSIAKQIADFMASGAPDIPKMGKKRTTDALWDFPDLPSPKRKRQSTPPSNARSSRDTAFPTSPGNAESIWAPAQHPRFVRPKRNAPVALPPDVFQSHYDGETLSQQLEAAVAATGRKGCMHCGTTTAPRWKPGPTGKVDLCNSCGVYWYRYGLMKPLNRMRFQTEAFEEGAGATEDGRGTLAAGHTANIGRRVSGSTPSVAHVRFTLDEDMLVIKLKEVDNLAWEEISNHLVGRSIYACQGRYSKQLFDKRCEARNALIEQGYVFPDNKGGAAAANANAEFYSREEDELLVQLREDNELDWTDVAHLLPGRNADSVERRYNTLKAPAVVQDPVDLPFWSKKRKRKSKQGENGRKDLANFSRYTLREEVLIKKLREEDGLGWAEIQTHIPGKTVLSVQKRYKREIEGKDFPSLDSLPPPPTNPELGTEEEQRIMIAMNDSLPEEVIMSDGLHKRKYTKEEDEAVMWLRDVKNLTWPVLAKAMVGRTMDGVRNRYEALVGTKAARSRQSDGAMEAEQEDGSLAAILQSTSQPAVEPNEDGHTQASANSNRFYSEDEDSMIIELKEEYKLGWEDIAFNMSLRSACGVQQRYKALRAKLSERCTSTTPQKSTTPAFPEGRQSLPAKLDVTLDRPTDDLLRAAVVNNTRRRTLPWQHSLRTEKSNVPNTTRDTDGNVLDIDEVATNAQGADDSPSRNQDIDSFPTPARSGTQSHPYFAPLPGPNFSPAAERASGDEDDHEEPHERQDHNTRLGEQSSRALLRIPGELQMPRMHPGDEQTRADIDTTSHTRQDDQEEGAGEFREKYSSVIATALRSTEDHAMTVNQMKDWMRENLESFSQDCSDYSQLLRWKNTLRGHLKHDQSFAAVPNSIPMRWTFVHNIAALEDTAVNNIYPELDDNRLEDSVSESHDDFCAVCDGGGQVVCCDGCSRCYHADCHAPPIEGDTLQSDDAWYCHLCVEDRDFAAQASPSQEPAGIEGVEYMRPSFAHDERDPADCYDPSLFSMDDHAVPLQTAPSSNATTLRTCVAQLTSDIYRDPNTSSPPAVAAKQPLNNFTQPVIANVASSSPFFFRRFAENKGSGLAQQTYGRLTGEAIKRRAVQYPAGVEITPKKATLELLETHAKPEATPARAVDPAQEESPEAAATIGTAPFPKSIGKAPQNIPSPASLGGDAHGELSAVSIMSHNTSVPQEADEADASAARTRHLNFTHAPAADSDPSRQDGGRTHATSRPGLVMSASSESHHHSPAGMKGPLSTGHGNAPMVPAMVIASSADARSERANTFLPLASDRGDSSSKGSSPDEIPARSIAAHPARAEAAGDYDSPTPGVIKEMPGSVVSSSFPSALAKASKQQKPSGRRNSTLNKRQAPLPRRQSNVKTVRNGKRVVSMPDRDVEGSEDELA